MGRVRDAPPVKAAAVLAEVLQPLASQPAASVPRAAPCCITAPLRCRLLPGRAGLGGTGTAGSSPVFGSSGGSLIVIYGKNLPSGLKRGSGIEGLSTDCVAVLGAGVAFSHLWGSKCQGLGAQQVGE